MPCTPIYLGPRRVYFNGITWTAEITKGSGIPDGNGHIVSYPEITANARTITITGTVGRGTNPTTLYGPFKYKYTDNIGHSASSNGRVQQLPSNITTIKITLNNNEAYPDYSYRETRVKDTGRSNR